MHRKKEASKETAPAAAAPVDAAKKLPAVPESVLKRRKAREAVKAARLKISIKVIRDGNSCG